MGATLLRNMSHIRQISNYNSEMNRNPFFIIFKLQIRKFTSVWTTFCLESLRLGAWVRVSRRSAPNYLGLVPCQSIKIHLPGCRSCSLCRGVTNALEEQSESRAGDADADAEVDVGKP